MFTLSTGKERRKISLSRSLFSLKVNLSHYFGYEGLVLRTLLGGFHRAVREGAGVGEGVRYRIHSAARQLSLKWKLRSLKRVLLSSFCRSESGVHLRAYCEISSFCSFFFIRTIYFT